MYSNIMWAGVRGGFRERKKEEGKYFANVLKCIYIKNTHFNYMVSVRKGKITHLYPGP